MAQQIARAINRRSSLGNATALDARTVQVRAPVGGSGQVRLLADIQNLSGSSTPQDAKIMIISVPDPW
ncbi:flagellar basal body P-ring protein FlgI [Shigella flexneri]